MQSVTQSTVELPYGDLDLTRFMDPAEIAALPAAGSIEALERNDAAAMKVGSLIFE